LASITPTTVVDWLIDSREMVGAEFKNDETEIIDTKQSESFEC
jgi:hypothetical protein